MRRAATPPRPSPITAAARRAGSMSGAHHHDLGSGPQSLGARLQIQSDRSKQPRPHHTLQNAWLLTLELAAQPLRRARQARRGRQGKQRLIAVLWGLCRHCPLFVACACRCRCGVEQSGLRALCCRCRGGASIAFPRTLNARGELCFAGEVADDACSISMNARVTGADRDVA